MAITIPATKLVALLNSVNTKKDMYVWVQDHARLALGPDPSHLTHTVDLGAEIVTKDCRERDVEPGEKPVDVVFVPQALIPELHHASTGRRSGNYFVEVMGRRIDFSSLKELLPHGLREIERIRPGMLEKLSQIRPRTKRIVARSQRDLFTSAHLVEKYAAPLMDGWWYGTNNSRDETNRWLERACNCAGLAWGKQFKTNLPNDSDSLEPL